MVPLPLPCVYRAHLIQNDPHCTVTGDITLIEHNSGPIDLASLDRVRYLTFRVLHCEGEFNRAMELLRAYGMPPKLEVLTFVVEFERDGYHLHERNARGIVFTDVQWQKSLDESLASIRRDSNSTQCQVHMRVLLEDPTKADEALLQVSLKESFP